MTTSFKARWGSGFSRGGYYGDRVMEGDKKADWPVGCVALLSKVRGRYPLGVPLAFMAISLIRACGNKANS